MCGKQDDKIQTDDGSVAHGWLNVSHFDSFEITKFAEYLTSIYGGSTVHSVKLHGSLGMNLDYRKQVTVKVSMIKYLDIFLQELLEHLITTSATLEAYHLFTLGDEVETL